VAQGFVTVPERSVYRLRNATIAAPLLSEVPAGVPVSPDGLARVDVVVRDGLVASVVPPETREGPEASVDLAGGQLWPCLIDVHTHLDKGHTWERAENRDGTFDGAIRAVSADRAVRWSADDVRRRMEFGIRCSGLTARRRCGLTWTPSRPAAVTWPVFEALPQEWAGRVELQAVSLVPLRLSEPRGHELADRVAAAASSARPTCRRRSIACSIACSAPPSAGSTSTSTATSGDVGARASAHRARDTAAPFRGRVVCGHCCSLAIQPPDVVSETLELVAQAGISVVSLPM
jgi:cytosine deaminase